MTPDFEYLIRLSPVSKYGHTIVGLFTFCLPVGLLVYFLYEYVLRTPLLDLVSNQHRHDVDSPTPRLSGASFGWICLSVVVGAATHVIWDSFTHRAGYFVLAWPVLSTELLSFGGLTVRVFNVLQHGSSLIGLAVLGAVGLSSLRRRRSNDSGDVDGWLHIRWRRLAAILTISLVGGALFGLTRSGAAVTVDGVRTLTVFGAIAAMDVLLLSLVAYAVLTRGAPRYAR